MTEPNIARGQNICLRCKHAKQDTGDSRAMCPACAADVVKRLTEALDVIRETKNDLRNANSTILETVQVLSDEDNGDLHPADMARKLMSELDDANRRLSAALLEAIRGLELEFGESGCKRLREVLDTYGQADEEERT